MRFCVILTGLVALVIAMAGLSASYAADEPSGNDAGPAVKASLNTLKDVQDAIKACWVWPSEEEIQSGMQLTVMLSFRRNGEMFGGRITHQSAHVSERERAVYYVALAETLRRCSPLPVSESLGHAIAGRPFIFTFTDTRKQKRI